MAIERERNERNLKAALERQQVLLKGKRCSRPTLTAAQAGFA